MTLKTGVKAAENYMKSSDAFSSKMRIFIRLLCSVVSL